MQFNKENINKIIESDLFNPIWYAQTYHNNYNEKNNIELLKHYLEIGWKEFLDPSEHFSTALYLADYPDVKEANINPLLHYVINGKKEKRIIQKHRDFPSFSLIMATYNRKDRISDAINSVLQQKTKYNLNFELIIADDGSDDGTVDILCEKYAEEIKNNKIRIISLNHAGVCSARNIAVAQARYDWICYIDDDNLLRHDFIQIFTESIIQNTYNEFFYAQHFLNNEKKVTEHSFDRRSLIQGNFIDLGSICHSKSLFEKVGGFDLSMKRLVDWDLIIRMTAIAAPVYIPKIVMDYNSTHEYSRISNSVPALKHVYVIFNKNAQERYLYEYIDQKNNINENKLNEIQNTVNKINAMVIELQQKLNHQEMTVNLIKQRIEYINIIVRNVYNFGKFKILKSVTSGSLHQKYRDVYNFLRRKN